MGIENKAIGPVAISMQIPTMGKEEYKKVIIRTKKVYLYFFFTFLKKYQGN